MHPRASDSDIEIRKYQDIDPTCWMQNSMSIDRKRAPSENRQARVTFNALLRQISIAFVYQMHINEIIDRSRSLANSHEADSAPVKRNEAQDLIPDRKSSSSQQTRPEPVIPAKKFPGEHTRHFPTADQWSSNIGEP